MKKNVEDLGRFIKIDNGRYLKSEIIRYYLGNTTTNNNFVQLDFINKFYDIFYFNENIEDALDLLKKIDNIINI